MQSLPDFNLKLLALIAASELPMQAQRAIKKSGVESRRALASNSSTSSLLINELAFDSDRETHHAALRRTDNLEIINQRINRETTCCAINIFRNPNTPAEYLISALNHSIAAVRLAAFVNPSTPLLFREAISTKSVIEMVNVGSFLGSRVVKSHEALLNNSFLYDRISEFDVNLRRASFADPNLSLEHYHLLRKSGYSRSAKRHPLLVAGDSWKTELDTASLIDLRSPAADLWLADDQGTTIDEAMCILDRDDYLVEPHIIARLLTRYGIKIIPGKRESVLAQSRIISSSWSNPAAAFYNDAVMNQPVVMELVNLIPQLSDAYAWDNLTTLATQWSDDLTSLFQAAKEL